MCYKCECGREFNTKKGLGRHHTVCKVYLEEVLPKLKEQKELERSKVRICKNCGKSYTYNDKLYGSTEEFCTWGCHLSYRQMYEMTQEERSNKAKKMWANRSEEFKKEIFENRSKNLSDETRKVFSDNAKKQMENPEARYRLHNLRMEMTPEERSRICSEREQRIPKEIRSQRARERMKNLAVESREAMIQHRRETMLATNGYAIVGKKSAETRKNWSEEQKREYAENASKSQKERWKNMSSEDARKYLKNSIYSTGFKYSETFWKNIFDAHNIPYEYQKCVHKKCNDGNSSRYYMIDFFINNKIAFEVDGSYHRKGSQPEYDAKRDKYLTDIEGYLVYRVQWIANDPKSREQQVQEFLKFYKENYNDLV